MTGEPNQHGAAGAAAQLSDDELRDERERKKYRNARRKARDAAGEIKELNITAMMDMMTILLVFLVKSFMSSSTNVTMADDLKVPNSSTTQAPHDNINVTITTREITVNDKRGVPVAGGIIPADFKDAGGMMIPSVHELLLKEVEKQKYIAKYNPKQEFTGKVNIICDKRVPYRTILEVLYTCGQAELSQYKLMALKASD